MPTITGADLRIEASSTPYFLDPTGGLKGFVAPSSSPISYVLSSDNVYPIAKFDSDGKAYIGRYIPVREMVISSISFDVIVSSTADNEIDVGIYDSAGSLVCSSGPTAGLLTSEGIKEIAITPQIIYSGSPYYIAVAASVIEPNQDIPSLLCADYTDSVLAGVFGTDFPRVLFDSKISVDDIQTVLTVNTDSGGFTLTFDPGSDPQETGAISYDYSDLQDGLEALSNIDVGDIQISSNVVTFQGQYLGINVPTMTADASGLSDGVSITVTTPGDDDPATNEVQNIDFGACDWAILTFGAASTSAFDTASTDSPTLETTLEGLSTIGAGNVSVSDGAGSTFDVEFTGTLAATNVDQITAPAAVEITETQSGDPDQTMFPLPATWGAMGEQARGVPLVILKET